MITTETVRLPQGMRASGEVDSVRVDCDAASFYGVLEPEGTRIEAEMTATVKKRTIPADEWAGGVEAADSLRAFGVRPVWVRRGR
jgi:hypothetical protein